MGSYNPDAPRILGQELVPIRDEGLVFSPAVNSIEVGHGFTLSTSRTLQDARFYLNTLPPGRSLGQIFLAQVYRRGEEERAGPVRSLIIPCNAGFISGGATLTNASSVPDAVADASDNRSITFPATGTPQASFHFATNSYSLPLNGKRILGVNLLYTMGMSSNDPIALPDPSIRGVFSVQNLAGDVAGFGVPDLSSSLIGVTQFSRVQLGEIDQFWSASAPLGTSDRFPWNYQGLQDFEASAGSGSRINFHYTHDIASGAVLMTYLAMEVMFCDETRLAYAGRSFGESGFSTSLTPYTLGVNILPFRDTAYNTNPVLPAGDYSVVISSADLGDSGGSTGLEDRQIALSQYPTLNALRDTYNLPTHPGIQVNVPFPMDGTAVGKVFTFEETKVLPQISIHTSAGPLTEVHVYGRQAAAQVYGSITATQEIDTSVLGGVPAQFPMVRFYARRFGETSVPLLLDSPSVIGSSVFISPAAFDALEEILDGWKEVTLPFTTPPTMGATAAPQWRWSAFGESAGNRWEVLGAVAPALSGTPGNLLNLVPAPNQLSIATYGAPISGAPINLGWVPGYAPLVSATTDDPTSDAVLLFAQNMPTVTGFNVSVLNQAVTGIGQSCGVDPIFIPETIAYNRLTWPYANTETFVDTFTRIAVASWGNASSGPAWVPGVPGVYSVDGSKGLVQPAATNAYYTAEVPGTAFLNLTGSFRIQSSMPASGADHWGAVWVHRATVADSSVYFRVGWEVGGAVTLYITNITTGTHTTLATTTIGQGYVPGTWVNVEFLVQNSSARAKAWIDGEPEPPDWQLFAALIANFGAGTIGTRTILGPGGIFATISYDNIIINNSEFGYYEIQRMDTVEPTWKTIMMATSPTVTGFSDFEARVGILTSYRIRGVTVLGFAGPWSSTITSTIPAPGITGREMTADSHVLIFTSNQNQNGLYNLAYSLAWEGGQITEAFTFPEAGFVQMQAQFNKDFYTAFRPIERGGEEFNRNILIQAAAIAPETLADFKSLRDMAWFNVNYVCVRDEDGNRWFSTVIVPSGRVMRDRRLYMASIKVLEVTDTPTPVDPS
jgi:hypothetical protein